MARKGEIGEKQPTFTRSESPSQTIIPGVHKSKYPADLENGYPDTTTEVTVLILVPTTVP